MIAGSANPGGRVTWLGLENSIICSLSTAALQNQIVTYVLKKLFRKMTFAAIVFRNAANLPEGHQKLLFANYAAGMLGLYMLKFNSTLSL